jgi:thiamine kinase-like enzyme
MFLGWAAWPLFERSDSLDKTVVADGVAKIFTAIHKLRVLHHDAESRNNLCDENGKLMVIDLERAKFHGRRL